VLCPFAPSLLLVPLLLLLLLLLLLSRHRRSCISHPRFICNTDTLCHSFVQMCPPLKQSKHQSLSQLQPLCRRLLLPLPLPALYR
jgi:hypothetical protein